MADKTTFFIIYDSFVGELNLSGLELLVYSLLYSFSTQGRYHHYSGSINYLARRTHASKSGVSKALKKLVDKGLIHKTPPLRKGIDSPVYTINETYSPVHSVDGRGTQSGYADEHSDNNIKADNKLDHLDMTKSRLLEITDLTERADCIKEFAYLFSNEDMDHYCPSYVRIVELLTDMITQPAATYKKEKVSADAVWNAFVMNLRQDELGLSIRDFIYAVIARIDGLNTKEIIDLSGYTKAMLWSLLKDKRLSEL